MRILILLMLLSAMLLSGCNSPETSHMATPVASYVQGDESKDCTALKEELTQLEKDISNKSKEADKEKSGNFLLGAAGCFSIIPWFYMDMDDVENAKTEVAALQERYNAISLIAYNKGCIVRQASPEITGKADTEKLTLVCKYCGPSDSKEWRIVFGQQMCNDCYQKKHGAKQMVQTISAAKAFLDAELAKYETWKGSGEITRPLFTEEEG